MAKAEVSKDGEKTIKITVSLDDDKSSRPAQPKQTPPAIFEDESRLFEIANLVTVTGQRNTEHGLTAVRLLEFRDEAQRQKIIHMLGESFEQVIQQMIPYLYLLGTHPRATVRSRVATAVGELMREVDFIGYKEKILIPWALSDLVYMNACVGLALETTASDSKYVENIKTLLHHWVTSPNFNFNWTAVASCVPLGKLWPKETLDLLELALKRDQFDLLVLATFVVRRLCDTGHTDLVLDKLSEWLDSDGNLLLRNAAVLIFLDVIEFEQAVKDGHLIDRSVDIFLVGLSDRKLTEAGLVRSAMLDKLKAWAEESFGDTEKQNAIETLFMRLYVRAETQRDKERITFHIQRWRQKDNRFAQIAQGLVQKTI